MVNFTGTPTGTCSSLISRGPSGCCKCHIHCLPTTKISTELGGRMICTDIEARRPDENDHADQRGDDRPGQLQHQRRVNVRRLFILRTPAVLHHEVENDGEDQEGEKQGDGGQQIVKLVDLSGDRGRRGRLKRDDGRQQSLDARLDANCGRTVIVRHVSSVSRQNPFRMCRRACACFMPFRREARNARPGTRKTRKFRRSERSNRPRVESRARSTGRTCPVCGS